MLRRIRCGLITSLTFLTALLVFEAQAQTAEPNAADAGESLLGSMDWWEDGLSEMCYYDAEETIYGKKRQFTRVQLVNRQWMDRVAGVKTSKDADEAIPVLKFNIAEEIPTENYNYRYLTTVFVRRDTLEPFKMVTSSQEWCGTTFKHLRWGSSRMELKCFSYFDGEGDVTFGLEREVFPFEVLPILARGVVADGKERQLKVLVPMRGTHLVQPTVSEIRLGVDPSSKTSKPRKTKAGVFNVRRVIASAGDGEIAWFDVEADAPHRLIAFTAGGVSGELKHFEKRPYWDRSNASSYHAVGAAP
ncbi:MAG: hypothetical protein R3E58_06640 [Phycisphaerae bacterium]|nr:hypothetical protein [Phycisphaerales bacterium]